MSFTDKDLYSLNLDASCYNPWRKVVTPFLGHSHSITNPERLCDELDETDVVTCFYLFGETLLETTHPYGQCPYRGMIAGQGLRNYE